MRTDEPSRAHVGRFVAGTLVGTVALLALGIAALFWSVPRVEAVDAAAPETTEFMVWRAGILGDSADEYALGWTPAAEVPELLLCAIVAAEDKRYFLHRGIDWVATRKALTRALRGRELVGASTITQQLARNLYLTGERSLLRKLQEALLARRLEAMLDKPQILHVYASRIEWGRGVWGIGAASRHYFEKTPAQLTPAEILHLTSVIPAPADELEGEALERYRARKRYTARRLHARGLLDDATYEAVIGSEPPGRTADPPEHLLSSGCGSIGADVREQSRGQELESR